jgi:hypothetical protein
MFLVAGDYQFKCTDENMISVLISGVIVLYNRRNLLQKSDVGDFIELQLNL